MSLKPKLYEWQASYYQQKDCNDPGDEPDQMITLMAEDATGEGDHFIAFKTKRWAIDVDEIDEWAQFIKDFLKGKLEYPKGDDED